MDSSSRREQWRKWRGRAVDLGLLIGLSSALIAVQIIDRLHSLNSPDQVSAVDLVFLLDQGPAMRGSIDALQANCIEKAEGLKSDGFDCRFAVVPFGPGRKRIPAVPLMSDLATFKQRLLARPITGDDPTAASGVAALEQALALDFRKDAPVLFFLISKAPCQDDRAVAGIADRMAERGITAIIQANAAEKDHCRSLYQNGGRFFSMEGVNLTGPSLGARSPGKADKEGSRTGTLLTRLAPDVKTLDSSQALKVKGVFSLRTASNRPRVVAAMGGNDASEMAVAEGLVWLARHQADEGYWSDQAKCDKEQPCQSLKHNAAVSETGLAILAFQAGGNYYFNDQKYSEHVTRGLDWLVEQQKEDGRLFGPLATWYEHGMGTFALAEACAVALANNQKPDPYYLDAAERAIRFMELHQYARGGWQYALDSPGIGDASVTGWQVLALKSAMEAKIAVSPETIERVEQFYESLGDPASGRTGYQSRGGGTDLTTAVGLIVQEFILKRPQSPLAQKAASYLQNRAALLGQSGDFYTLYNGTLAMFLARGDAWKQWNLGVRDAVVKRQEKRGCARGSWHDKYGRTLGTAWAVLTLEVYYRYATSEVKGEE